MREGKWVCVRPTWGSASGTHFCQAFSDCAGGALVCGWGLHSRSRASGSGRVLLACLHCKVQKSRGHVFRHDCDGCTLRTCCGGLCAAAHPVHEGG